MKTSIKNQINLTPKEITLTMINLLTSPLGSMFSWNCGSVLKEVEKVEENTFQILKNTKGCASAEVDGDTLINLFLGKTNLSTLKFE